MADRNMKFNLDFLAKTQGLKNAQQAVNALGDDIDETGDKGKALAKILSASADKIEADLEQTAAIAGRLKAALGDAFSANLGDNKINAMAADMQRLGITTEDVDQNIDEIASSIKRLDAAESSLGNMGLSMNRLGSETDNTRSVFANFAGNAAQELPGVAGAFGPLNMAISQFTEYAAEGNVQLANFVKFAGPIALIGGLIAGVANEFQEAAEQKKKLEDFNASQIKTFTEAIKDNVDAADALVEKWDEAGEVVAHFAVGPGTFAIDSVSDISDALAEAGITLDIFAEASTNGADGLAMLDQLLHQAGISGATYDVIMSSAAATSENYAKTQENAARWAKLHGEETETAAERMSRAARRADALNDTIDRQTEAYDKATQAIQDHYDATRSSIDANFAQQRALADVKEAIEEATTAQDDLSTSTNEAYDAQLSAQESAFGYADAMVELADQQAKARGETLSTADKQGVMIAALQNVQSTIEPGSPLWLALQQYIDQLKSVPTSINTNFTATGIKIGGKGQGAPMTVKPGQKAARGLDSARPGLTLVGEEGPELVVMGGGERVIPATETSALLSAGAGGGPSFAITVNAGMGADGAAIGRAVVDAITAAYKDGHRAPWMGVI